MKRILSLLSIGLASLTSVYAQEKSIANKTAIGFDLALHQADYGVGLNVSTPYFAKKRLTLRLRGAIMWHQHLNSTNTTSWTPYSNLTFGVSFVSEEISNFLRLYAEGGGVALFPSGDFSSKKYKFGGYGLFGFEFFLYERGNYFIEIGGIGTKAVADRVVGEPIYSNGILLNVGYRYHF